MDGLKRKLGLPLTTSTRSQTLLHDSIDSSQGFHETPIVLEPSHSNGISEVSFGKELTTSLPSVAKRKAPHLDDGYEAFEHTVRSDCQRPSLATVMLVFVLTIIFVGLPVVYLLHCFDVINAQWDAERHALLMQTKHELARKNEIHYIPTQWSNGQVNKGTGKYVIHLPDPPVLEAGQCAFKDNDKIDCYPESDVNQTACQARGCCWEPRFVQSFKSNRYGIDVPYCFYPAKYGGYDMGEIKNGKSGRKEVRMIRTFRSPYPNDMKVLKVQVVPRSQNCVQIRISTPENNRYSPMYPEIPVMNSFYKGPYDYDVQMNKTQLGFKVVRGDTVIFDAQDVGGFIYADQILQLSARLPTGVSLYGLGEHQESLRLNMNWQRYTLFNADQLPKENMNLYGSQPFFLAVETSGASYGVFLHNSNAMDVILQPSPAITYRTIGGIFDFYVMTGPSPQDVVRQYTDLVGKPFMPPFWSLGFHLCRYGTRTLNDTKYILRRNQQAGIPIDVQWNDLDYMKNNNDFSFDNQTFTGLPEFVKYLHSQGLKWIPLVDAGISASEPPGTYPPYDHGIRLDCFVKNISNQPFIGKVWNRGLTVWPDFTHINAHKYWTTLLKSFHDLIAFDGTWLDMNEPSNFYSGSATGCPSSNLEDPPYVPNVNGGSLKFKTFCMTAKQTAGNHYDVHNIYGMSEVAITFNSLSQIRPTERPFIISRSTYAGLGKYGGHWSGDVVSTWYDMKKTISDLLAFSIFGIPMMGSDICGFNGNTTVELCARWYQLGAFYPFSRTHNTDDAIPQDPTALGELVLNSARKSLLNRYSLLSYLYTLFYHAHVDGSTVARPLFFEFTDDPKTHGIDEQFLWGAGLMIVPVLDEGAVHVTAYMPSGVWYDYYNGSSFHSTGAMISLPAPLDTIPLLVRGGYIIPMQAPNMTTATTRTNHLDLLVALDDSGYATGDVYFDHGDLQGSYENNQFSYINMTAKANHLLITVEKMNFKPIPKFGKMIVLGVTKAVHKVLVNEQSAKFTYDEVIKILRVENLNQDLPGLHIYWM